MKRLFVLLLLVGFASGCQEDVPDEDIAQFNQPGNVTLVCYDEQLGSLPLEQCRNSSRTDARIYAFVTQTVYGEVAVVDLEDVSVIDQSQSIPFNSFVPVGGQPVDIASSADGQLVYTVNYETRDISVVDVAEAILGDGFTPARSVPLPASGAQIVPLSYELGETPAHLAAVTIPELGEVAVVALEEMTVVDDEGQSVVLPAGVLATVRLDGGLLATEPVNDGRIEGVAPTAMVASSQTGDIFVGGRADALGEERGSYVAQFHAGVLMDRAVKAALTQGPGATVDAEQVVLRRLNLGEYTVRNMSIEPELERWIYLVENERGGVVVLDLQSGQMVPVNDWDETAEDPYSLAVPGLARSVKLVRFHESVAAGDVPTHLTFNGTYALVSTTQSAVYVIDVAVDDEIGDQVPDFSMIPHSFHPLSDWYEEDGAGNMTPLLPALEDLPDLYVDGEKLQDGVSIFEPAKTALAGDGVCGDGATYRMDDEEGAEPFYFNCDTRISSSETWQMVYHGALGVSGAGVIQSEADGAVVFTDEYKDFCTVGVLGPAGDDLWGQVPDGEAAGPFEVYRGFTGDLVEITSPPVALNSDIDCSEYEGDDVVLRYRIDGVVDAQTLRIVPIKGNGPLPNRDCFGQAFTYQVLAGGQSFVLSGTRTPVIHRGSMVDGACVPWVGPTPQADSGWRNTSRVFSKAPFENRYFTFTPGVLTELPDGRSADDVDEVTYTFITVNGFVPLSVLLGADITDIELAPNDDILFVDQSSKGLIIFDMLGEFQPRENIH